MANFVQIETECHDGCFSTGDASHPCNQSVSVMPDVERAYPSHLGFVDLQCLSSQLPCFGARMLVVVSASLSFLYATIVRLCHSHLLSLVWAFAFCLLSCGSCYELWFNKFCLANAGLFLRCISSYMPLHAQVLCVPFCRIEQVYLPRVYISLYNTLKCMRLICLLLSGSSSIVMLPRFDKFHIQHCFQMSLCLTKLKDVQPILELDFSKLSFDSSLGFPGEGPWALMSANIDSFQTHADCVLWDADVVALQEARLSKNNFELNRKRACEFGKDIFVGELLSEKKDINGFYKTPHGGTALLSPPECSRSFHKDDDVTGTWEKLEKTSRVSGMWYQVLPKFRILVFSFYGQACLAHDSHLDINQKLLEDLMIITAQFGSIPILVAGDFQADPDIYPSIADAKALGGWADPLVQLSEQGEPTRPITFSRGGNFKNPCDNFSSIDGILMNQTALGALTNIRVCFEHAKQHAPIQAVFEWPRIFQKGFVHCKPAAFDLTNIPHEDGTPCDLNPIAIQIWNDKFVSSFDQADDETAWKFVNQLAVSTLLTAGAKFSRGPKQRGETPTFKQVNKCPGQDWCGNAHSKLSTSLTKTFKLVTELRFRLSRVAVKYSDFCNTWNLQQKVYNHLQKIASCKWWNPDVHMHDNALKCVLTCLQDSINKTRNHEKRNRIAEWKRKMIQGTKSKQIGKMVFKWIKSKAALPAPNLIRDSEGHIIVNPTDAINEINSQWDTVYAANVLHTDPMEVLKFAWPHIHETRKVADIPPIKGSDLRNQALRRKNDAAPGLDGWRTCEMKLLPCAVYDAAARFFHQVENGSRRLPSCLVLARQIILEKKGDEPLQKRLISLLPIFLLCYTSVRFRQLQSWQMWHLPKQLYGGIKNRKMSQLQSQIRLSLDNAKESGQHLIGIKLDKAKCFDRLIPSVASALMLAFGVPSSVVMMFSQIYANLRRLLSYKGWISTTPTTCANSVIQGCSLSLIAINVHMALWCILIDKLPRMFSAVYVDDSYLWTYLDNCRVLREAIELTSNWDSLTGQLVNQNKSSTWASNTIGRKILQENFPNITHEKVIDVLGARLNTTEQKTTAWDPQKTRKILRDLKSIKALPCPVAIKEHLIGLKITPQLSFVPHLSAVPKKDLKVVQDQLASIIWKNRPMWRCRWLIIAMLASPHRSDPFLSRAYNTVIETVHFLKNCSCEERHIWTTQVESSRARANSLLNCFRQSCALLGISHSHAFHLCFFDAEPVCFLDFGKKELQSLLKIVVRHQCYKFATEIKRKEVKPCTGFLNFPLTMKKPRTFKNLTVNGLSLKCFWESQVAGCTVTNDRKAKAGFCNSNLCRFCNCEPESLEHIIDHCTAVPFAEEKPSFPDACGSNFKLLGIVEVQQEQATFRLQISSTSDIPVEEWNCLTTSNPTTLWTDGSCDFPDLFWETCGGFAVVNHLGYQIAGGPVHHIALSSYTCELWAILWAFSSAVSPVEIRSDSKTVVDQLNHLIDNHTISAGWMHFEWWCFLKAIFLQRCELIDTPLIATWIPAHVLENLPCESISEKLARAHMTTWTDIFCNRKADLFAKRACRLHQHNDPKDFSLRCEKIGKWQLWLTKLNSAISSLNMQEPQHKKEKPNEDATQSSNIQPSMLTVAHPTQFFEAVLPKWMWTFPNGEIWKSQATKDCQITYASISHEDWTTAVDFYCSIQWCLNESFCTSFLELAFLFWDNGFRFQDCNSPAKVATLLKKCVNQGNKHENCAPLTPGSISSKAKSNGKTFPAGYVKGGYPKIPTDTLKKIAIAFFHGKTQSLKDWLSPF